YATILVHAHLPGGLVEHEAAVRAFGQALLAAAALLLIDVGLAVAVLLGLVGARAAAHADVLDGAAEPGELVALGGREAHEHVGVHDGAADLRRLHVLAARHRHLHVVGALHAVADEDGAARRERREAVLPCALQVLEGVLAA